MRRHRWLIISTPASTPPARPMSTSSTRSHSESISLSDFYLRFSEAIRTYHKRTRNDLFFHPFASLFQSCNDSTVALSLLQRHARVSLPPRFSDERLKSLFTPTLSGLYNISSGVHEGVLVIVDVYSFRTCILLNGVFFSGIQLITGESYLSCHWRLRVPRGFAFGNIAHELSPRRV